MMSLLLVAMETKVAVGGGGEGGTESCDRILYLHLAHCTCTGHDYTHD